MKTNQPSFLSANYANMSGVHTRRCLLFFMFVFALSTLQALPPIYPPSFSQQFQADPTFQLTSSRHSGQQENLNEEINVYGFHFTGVDAEGLEQSFWLAVFAGTEEDYRESWIYEQLNENGTENTEELTPGQVQKILEEVGILEFCFSEGSGERNCLYLCDPGTKRRVKRICFIRNAAGGLIAVTIDPIIERPHLSRRIMRRIAEQPRQIDRIREQLEAQIGRMPTIVLPEGREFYPH